MYVCDVVSDGDFPRLSLQLSLWPPLSLCANVAPSASSPGPHAR